MARGTPDRFYEDLLQVRKERQMAFGEAFFSGATLVNQGNQCVLGVSHALLLADCVEQHFGRRAIGEEAIEIAKSRFMQRSFTTRNRFTDEPCGRSEVRVVRFAGDVHAWKELNRAENEHARFPILFSFVLHVAAERPQVTAFLGYCQANPSAPAQLHAFLLRFSSYATGTSRAHAAVEKTDRTGGFLPAGFFRRHAEYHAGFGDGFLR